MKKPPVFQIKRERLHNFYRHAQAKHAIYIVHANCYSHWCCTLLLIPGNASFWLNINDFKSKSCWLFRFPLPVFYSAFNNFVAKHGLHFVTQFNFNFTILWNDNSRFILIESYNSTSNMKRLQTFKLFWIHCRVL